jgi:DNA-binding FadR family transcriptional regulator
MTRPPVSLARGHSPNGQSLRSPKVSELLARALVEQILAGELKEGDVLLTERDMMAAHGVGRSTVREALRLLETRGVVTIRKGLNGGPIVRIPKPSDLSESLSLILSFTGASLADLLTTRLALEPVLAGLASDLAKPADLTSLQSSVDDMRASLGDPAIFRRENERFHTEIARIANNPVLLSFIESVKGISDGMTAGVSYSEQRRLAVVDAHERIVVALRSSDREDAVAAMRQHLDEAGKYWRDRYGPIYRQPVNWLL